MFDGLLNWMRSKLMYLATTLISGGVIIVAVYLILLSLNRVWDRNINLTETGAFGDFVGGFVGTMFSLAGFIVVYYTFLDQKDATEKDKIEGRFFELIKLHKENLNEISYEDSLNKEISYNGRETFDYIYHQVITCSKEIAPFFKDVTIDDVYNDIWVKQVKVIMNTNLLIDGVQLAQCDIAYSMVFFGTSYGNINTLLRLFDRIYKPEFIRKIAVFLSIKPSGYEYLYFWRAINSENLNVLNLVEVIEQFRLDKQKNQTTKFEEKYINLLGLLNKGLYPKYYIGFQFKLSHYFRHIFQTITYINNQKILSYKEKYEYVKIFRAQLSIKEQYLIFFNSLSFMGRQWEYNYIKLNATDEEENHRLITKYNLISNLPDLYINEVMIDNYYPVVDFEFKQTPALRKAMENKFN